ncbi:MAG: hypothetical protein OXU66_11595 [Gammaproteobacteria bacterium]|nr:hypothetical protein [Gammaproteobacteria bacterium]MDD9959573.1 hypothetical protein [Gammaproteobacteria bacterium]
MRYRYRGSVILIPDTPSWDFKGKKVLPEHAMLPIPDNVISFDPDRKKKELKSPR